MVRNDRSATLTLYDNKGKNKGSYKALAKGQNRNRMVKDGKGDTPHGTYKIPGWRDPDNPQSAKNKKSYGPNPRLMIEGETGEAKDSNRDLLRVHGGDKSSDGELRSTHGCIRLSNEDMKTLYDNTQELEANDEAESPETLEVITSADDARRDAAARNTTIRTQGGMEEMY